MRTLAFVLSVTLCACSGPVERQAPDQSASRADQPALYPGETPQLRALITQYAAVHDIPEALLHAVIQRESDHRADARNGPYYGLMQILPETAAQMGFRGAPEDLLDAETNLIYAGRYLRGAWLLSDGDIQTAIMWYARGYYFEARDRCMLVETGLRDREVRRDCP